MTTKLLRLNSLRIRLALCIPFVLLPITVLGSVSFPSNPQTSAECDVPAVQMRAMKEREYELVAQARKERDALPYEPLTCRGNDCVRPITDPIRARLHEEMRIHGKEGDRIHDELRALEKTCLAAARANEQTATLLLELRNDFVEANNAYEKAKVIYERIRTSPYTRRNDAFSAELGGAMSVAKRYILGLIPKSRSIRNIQNASFIKLRSEIQQLNGDMAALESAIQSVRAEAPPTEHDTASVPLPRRGGSSGAEMFQQAITQAEQDESDRPAREARERAAKAAAVTAEARQTPEDRLRKNYDQRITAAQEQCAASKKSCDSGCTGVAVVGLLTMFASKGAGADEASAQIQQCSNRCDGAKSSCDQQVSSLEQEKSQAIADARNPQGSTASSSGVTQAPSGGGARGLPVEECHRQANASNLGDKLNAIPRSDTVLLLRGAIHNLDFLIRTYTQCLPEQGSQNAINGWKTQREQSLRTCRQISSSDNCLDSPFNVAAARQDSSPASLPKPGGPTGCAGNPALGIIGIVWDGNGKCIGSRACCAAAGGDKRNR